MPAMALAHNQHSFSRTQNLCRAELFAGAELRRSNFGTATVLGAKYFESKEIIKASSLKTLHPRRS
jgi:hypothetical protein